MGEDMCVSVENTFLCVRPKVNVGHKRSYTDGDQFGTCDHTQTISGVHPSLSDDDVSADEDRTRGALEAFLETDKLLTESRPISIETIGHCDHTQAPSGVQPLSSNDNDDMTSNKDCIDSALEAFLEMDRLETEFRPITIDTIVQVTDVEREEKREVALKPKKLTDKERFLKRLRIVQAVQATPGYLAYIASLEKNVICDQVPQEPDPHDVKISKRTWEDLVRKWKRALQEFGCVQIQLTNTP